MAEQAIRLALKEAVAEITLARPQARNALSVAMCEELLATLDQVGSLVAQASVRVLVLRAEGPAFCAGADLKERRGMAPDAASRHSRLIAACADKLADLPCPAIACVHGAAMGGGFELALGCDLRVASSAATFAFPEVGFGFFPGAGGPVRLVRLVGHSVATYLLMTGERIDGQEAYARGIVHVVASPEGLEEATGSLARRVAAFPPNGVRALRALLAGIDAEPRAAGMALARRLRDSLDDDPAVRRELDSFARR